jgi:hypothetical protein
LKSGPRNFNLEVDDSDEAAWANKLSGLFVSCGAAAQLGLRPPEC